MSLRKIKLQALERACDEYRKAYDHCWRLNLRVNEWADAPVRSSMQREALSRYVKAQEQHQLAIEAYEATGASAGYDHRPGYVLSGAFHPPGRSITALKMCGMMLVLLGVGAVTFYLTL